jgi:hypothetical protein
MIYYPLTTLMLAGMREILLISTPAGPAPLPRLLGDGSAFGLRLLREQPSPRRTRPGLHHRAATSSANPRADPRRQHLLRPRTSRGAAAAASPRAGRTIFAYAVRDPERYGVVEFDAAGRAISLEEKPTRRAPLRRHGAVLLRRPRSAFARSSRPRRAASSRSPTSTASTSNAASCGRVLGRGYRLARHRHARIAAAGLDVHRDDREAAGAQDRLPRGSGLAHGFHRRRLAAAAPRCGWREKSLRRGSRARFSAGRGWRRRRS